MPWTRLLFKNQAKVYVKVDEAGRPRASRGLVEIRYQLAGKSYQASVANLSPLPEGPEPLLPDEAAGPSEAAPKVNGASRPAGVALTPPDHELPASPAPKRLPAPQKAPALPGPVKGDPTRPDPSPLPTDRIEIYADGACSGNPGPAGLGVYLRRKEGVRELSEYLGHATNNIAELTAIQRALEMIPEPDRGMPIYIYTDSAYSIGLLTQNWKPKANQELVRDLRALCRRFPRLVFKKVAGHAGIYGNEKADLLARQAIERRA